MTIVIDGPWFRFPRRAEFPLVTGRHEIPVGAVVCLEGGNGTGKSTLLRALAGIDAPTRGSIEIPPNERVALVPTEVRTLLLPWYTGAANLGFFARVRPGSRSRDPAVPRRIFGELLGLSEERAGELLGRYPYEMSAGEEAALALACAIETDPTVLLLDETFANASNATAHRMMHHLDSRRTEGMTVIFTAHRGADADVWRSQRIRMALDE